MALIVFASGLLMSGAVSKARQTPSPQSGLSTIGDYPLAGNSSRFDYLSLDAGGHRLYIAHLGAGTVLVFDAQAGNVVAEIAGVPGAHGVVAVPELGRVYATATDANQVAVIDATSLSVVATIDQGGEVGNTVFDPGWNRVYVAAESGPLSVVDEADSDVRELARGDVGPNAHSIAVDPQTHHLLTPIANLGGGPVLRELPAAAPAE